MDQWDDTIVARMLHHRTESLLPGDPVAARLMLASSYFLPGTPQAMHQYGRWSNPTWDALEGALGVLEAAQVAIFPSGMAAVASVFMAHLKSGDRLLLPSDGYYTSRVLAEKYLEPHGIKVELCSTLDYTSRDFAGLRMVYVETPSNPSLDICDLADIAARAKQAGALMVCDNTTMTPLGQRPLDLGADIVVASDTKAINGHSDALMGHVATRDAALLDPILDWRKLVGAIPGPFEAWLVHRGLESFEVRYERMSTTAAVLADRFSAHRVVKSVTYPGLASDPGHDIAKRQMTNFGTLVGVTLADATAAERFITDASLIVASTSFGGVHTSAERRARWGDKVAEGYVRLSVGCEPTEALWRELNRVLDELN
ncbi:cystathionine gamma-lyase [Mesorhizobium denitrificans]|uniref:Cystathionine gamma-lyase n=2 Tax=Phyllobacteriaceae TaxID=69277 RepID=A0A371XCQ9_9HYPH|nr:cystathionine gamma-lyase [Mesorhizobium denitrificans]